MKSEYQSMLQAGIEKKYLMLEEEIEKDIIRRIQKAGKITSTADWQIQRYMVLGHSTEDVENIIRQAVGGDWVDTFRLYDEVIEQEYVRCKALYEQVNAHFVPYEQNYELKQITNALIQQSNDELFNISKSLGFMVDMGGGRKVFTPLSEIYNGYLDNAITMMASGAFDYNTMIRKVVGEMTASGLRTVDYASGHSNRVDVAVRRALLTGMGQLTGQISRMNGQALGTDKYEVDWHPGARPDHAKWQGRVWTYQQLIDVCGLGSGPGLLGWNCRHTYYPFLEGISARNYSDQWLEEMDRKEAQKIPYRGKEYNTYEATQKQRQMETAMRAQREKVQLLKQGGADPDDILNARCKYQAMLDEYSEFSKKFNLPEQRERIYYDLRGRVAPSQRTYKKWQAEQVNRAKERAEKKRRADMRAEQKEEQKASQQATFRSTSGISADFADKMSAALKKSPHDEVKRVYAKYQSEIKCLDNAYKSGAFFRRSEGGIRFNEVQDAVGSNYQVPFEVAFHEFGHNIDWLIGGKNPLAVASNTKYNGNRLKDVIKQDYLAFRKSLGIKNHRDLIKALKDEDIPLKARGNISDILEGCTNISYPLGVGHGASYHKRPGATEGEFFAEVLDSAAVNPESFDQMKRVFPNAVQMVLDIVKEAVK